MKTVQGIDVKFFWNSMTCIYYECCNKRQEREKTLLKHVCMYNPSVFECEEFKRLNKEVIYDLNCL